MRLLWIAIVGVAGVEGVVKPGGQSGVDALSRLLVGVVEELCKSFGEEYWAGATLEELLDGMYGDEFFWEEIV